MDCQSETSATRGPVTARMGLPGAASGTTSSATEMLATPTGTPAAIGRLALSALHELFVFGLKEARACVFAGSFFALLFLSVHLPLFGVHRYDFLFIAAVLIQLVLYATGIETRDEVKVIFLFHVIGMGLELYKTSALVGSWSYPEPAFFKIGTVPLYSGFMYAAVGSYISQAWRILDLTLTDYTRYGASVVLCVLIYANFFTNHFAPDVRWELIVIVFVFFWRTRVHFTVVPGRRRSMPLTVSFGLIAFFIWVAENISTFFGAWKYPNQVHVWNVVNSQKITSWFLLVIVGFIIVAYLKHYKRSLAGRGS